MAKYTALLSDFLADGGTLPAVFQYVPDILIDETNDIKQSFNDLFTLHFLEREIGFETYELFNAKLTGKAIEVCPFYARKIKALDGVKMTSKTTKTVTPDLTVENVNKDFVNPVVTDGELSDGSVASGQKGKQTTQGSTTEIIDDEGRNFIESAIEYQNEIKNLYTQLLNEFDCLFMGVF